MKDGTVGLREIALAGDTLQLAPGLVTGMPIGADITPAKPTMVGALRIGTEMLRGVDRAAAAQGEDDHRRWQAGRLRARIGSLLTRVAERFVEESSKRLGCFGAFVPALMGFQGSFGYTGRVVGPPDMAEEADQRESNHKELAKQEVRRHEDVPFPDGERRLLYRIHPLSNYPLPGGTRPARGAPERTAHVTPGVVRLASSWQALLQTTVSSSI